ncbi:hypothetical protein Rs2_09904 [Raphanus sativus]|nr:hypothetical protein Rs2_09904 [Raphanus sativus]
MAPISLHRDDGAPENMVALPCLKSMTWGMESKNTIPGGRVAVINLKVCITRTRNVFCLWLYISEQLSAPANRVAVINLKLQDTETTNRRIRGQISGVQGYTRGNVEINGLYPLENQMGATTSRIDEDKALQLCRERKKFVQQALDGRCLLAAAHVSYVQSLKNTGTALRKFAETEVPVESSLYTSTTSATPRTSSRFN